jgi:hypothetical protein
MGHRRLGDVEAAHQFTDTRFTVLIERKQYLLPGFVDALKTATSVL